MMCNFWTLQKWVFHVINYFLLNIFQISYQNYRVSLALRRTEISKASYHFWHSSIRFINKLCFFLKKILLKSILVWGWHCPFSGRWICTYLRSTEFKLFWALPYNKNFLTFCSFFSCKPTEKRLRENKFLNSCFP